MQQWILWIFQPHVTVNNMKLLTAAQKRFYGKFVTSNNAAGKKEWWLWKQENQSTKIWLTRSVLSQMLVLNVVPTDCCIKTLLWQICHQQQCCDVSDGFENRKIRAPRFDLHWLSWHNCWSWSATAWLCQCLWWSTHHNLTNGARSFNQRRKCQSHHLTSLIFQDVCNGFLTGSKSNTQLIEKPFLLGYWHVTFLSQIVTQDVT